ncbi:hypothetical protein I316_01832 [Kwoniella heveanensis BCC8398]|uniref:USP domain-containing protein n=1 Tax=Kwoniella heveanensis BCC8398 TaxID=1296120 RepID=A0A1B9GZX9_9TREE|nr:hypothetical protein I316_01832 [Kwoniella heveanensis BCC8398]
MAVTTPQSQSPISGSASKADVDGNSASASSSSGRAVHLKPIGIHNESNTCFLNSTFQALSATAPLTSLLSTSPYSPLHVHSESSLPAPAIHPKRIPSLHPDILEPPLYELTPVTRAFTQMLHKAWRMKEAGGGTTGSSETSSKRSMSLVPLLREIARKYDQYDDYSQQDAHELLRHLLDSMEMEEKDVIKKIQPSAAGQHDAKRRRGRNKNRNDTPQAHAAGSASRSNSHLHLADLRHISPMSSPLPSPAHTRPPSPGHGHIALPSVDPMSSIPQSIHQQFEAAGQSITEEQTTDPSAALVQDNADGIAEAMQEIPAEERLIPFVDVLFGGSLASVVVCERCKAVSHTYEGFLDISLSLKGDDPKPRKRDRLRAMAQKLRPRRSSAQQSPETTTSAFPAALSDGEFSESETPTNKNTNRRRSLDQDDRSSSISRSSSTKGFGGLKNKSSFSFRRKGTRSVGTSPVISASNSFNANDNDKTPPISQPGSPKSHPHGQNDRHIQPHHHSHHHHRGPGPTPAQAAYIARILTPPGGGAPDASDPLAKLRAANSGEAPSPTAGVAVATDSGLVESLKAFTSVEVLEGENAFACHKCWKIKHGRYAKHEATVREEDEDQAEQSGNADPTRESSISDASGSSANGPPPISIVNPRAHAAAPAISILGSPSPSAASASADSAIYFDGDDSRLGRQKRNPSIASSMSRASIARTSSPLRRQLDDQQETLAEQMSSVTLSTTYGSESALTMTSSTGTSITEDAEAGTSFEGATGTGGDSSSSDGLSDSESSSEEDHQVDRPKIKRRKTNHAHVVMGRAFKRYLIAKAPEIMVFHFKRFKQTHKSNYGFSSFYDLKKIDDFVSFPELLDLAPFLAPNRRDYKVQQTSNGPRATYMEWANPEQGPSELEPVMYRLYAVVVHLGTMIGGHYISYCLVDPEKMFGARPSIDSSNGGEGGSKTPVFDAQGRSSTTDNNAANAARSDASVRSGQSGAGSAANGGWKKDRRVWCFCSE